MLALSPLGAQNNAEMFRGDAAHSGTYSSTAPMLATVKWRFHANGRFISSPTFSGGVVYVGSSNGNLYALHAGDGSLVWKFEANGPVNSTPAVSNGLVYFASLDGNVYAVNAFTGLEKWRFKTKGERRFTAPGIHGMIPRAEVMPDPFDVFLSSPVIAGSTVYIGSGDHNVYALDAASGALKWKFTTGNVVHATPAVADGIVYVGSWDRYMYALNARSGALEWKFATGDDRNIYNQVGIAGSAAIARGALYFGCRDSFFYALDARTGRLRWKHDEHGSWVIASPAIDNGVIYYTTSDERKFFGLDAASGAARLSVGYGAFAFSSPAIASHVAYYGSFDGRLYGVDVRTGKIVARFSTDASRKNLSAHLDAAGNLDFKTIYSEQTLDGIILGLGRIYGLGAIIASPAIADGVLFIGDADGTFYALR